MGEMRNAYNVFVRKPKGKKPLGRHRYDEKIILELILEK
jgi:hypothetical protein